MFESCTFFSRIQTFGALSGKWAAQLGRLAGREPLVLWGEVALRFFS
jgi:hypothetical protein